MRFIPTRLHAIADYAVGIALIALPFILGWSGAQRSVLIIIGAVVIIYSLLTDYEFGVLPAIPVRVHLLLDAAVGVALILSPWLFGPAPMSLWPYLTFGVLVFAATTKHHAETRNSYQSVVRPQQRDSK